MAVPKHRVTRSRKNMKFSAKKKFSGHNISTDSTTGTLHLRHHVTVEGFYRGKQVIGLKSENEDQAE